MTTILSTITKHHNIWGRQNDKIPNLEYNWNMYFHYWCSVFQSLSISYI